MKILFDIDYLGSIYGKSANKSGIYRVIDTLLKGLLHNPQDIDLVAQDNLRQAVRYIAEDPELVHCQMSVETRWMNNLIHETDARFKHWEKQAFARVGHERMPLVGKLHRKALYTLHNFIPKRPYHIKIKDDVFRNGQVYHSPFGKITPRIRSFRNLHCFLTVYDLIPILLPHQVPQETTFWTELAIKSLQPQDFVFSISQATKDDLCNYRTDLDPDHVQVTHLAASKDTFFPCHAENAVQVVKKRYNIPEQARYFLGLGNVAPHKNFQHVIESFAKLIRQERLPEAYLVIAGTFAWYYDTILEAASEASIRNRIIFTGRVADEDLSALYSGSLGFVFMSLYEGFGLPPLEAMQCGVPVITSNTSSLPEVVGDAGIMLDPTDEDGLCQAMLNLHNSSSLREEMAQKSLRQAAKFSWDKTVRQTIEGYHNAIRQ